jgi:hypothetical protein
MKKPVPAPYIPLKPNKSEVLAWMALKAGTATPDQQQKALAMLINTVCETYGLSYRPGDPDGTSFAEGKRFVGLQIVKMLNTNPDTIKE